MMTAGRDQCGTTFSTKENPRLEFRRGEFGQDSVEWGREGGGARLDFPVVESSVGRGRLGRITSSSRQ